MSAALLAATAFVAKEPRNRTRSLLPGNTESLTGTAGTLGVLALDLEAPEVTETSMLADLLHALLVFSESSINHV